MGLILPQKVKVKWTGNIRKHYESKGYIYTKNLDEFDVNWVKEVFKRDNYTCQCCGKHGGNLNAHHLYNFSEYEDLRYDVNNGLTLCEQCHLVNYPNSFHSIYGERNNTPEQMTEFIKNYKERNKEAV